MSAVSNNDKASGRGRRQCAALPIRFTGEGKLQVLLLTSRDTGRWVIPKGWPMRRYSAAEAAAREAYEEAGVEGWIAGETPIGRYTYEKQLPAGGRRKVVVDVFLLRVVRQLASWPEKSERKTAWFDPEDAADKVAEPKLAAILMDARDILFARS
jgi:8-oxo-dGTP pyrophosphatase MutT (NUDIX family)